MPRRRPGRWHSSRPKTVIFTTVHGVDVGGIARAAYADWHHEQFQGASTITQQLARKLFLTDEVSISRNRRSPAARHGDRARSHTAERNGTRSQTLSTMVRVAGRHRGCAAHTYIRNRRRPATYHRTCRDARRYARGAVAVPRRMQVWTSAKERQRHVWRADARERFHHARARAGHRSGADRSNSSATGRRGGNRSWHLYFTTYVTNVVEAQFGSKAAYVNVWAGRCIRRSIRPCKKLGQEAIDWGIARAKVEGIGAGQAALVAIRPSTSGEILSMAGGAERIFTGQPIQSGLAGAPPARLVLQSIRVHGRRRWRERAADDDSGRYARQLSDGRRNALSAARRRRSFFCATHDAAAGSAQSRNVVAVKLASQLGIEQSDRIC